MDRELYLQMLNRIEKIGRAKQLLDFIFQSEAFDGLSKHDPYWNYNEKDTPEIIADRLHDIRLRLSLLQEKLCEVFDVLTVEEE